MKGITNEISNRLIYLAVKMVLDGTPVGMSIAVLAQANGLKPEQAVWLKNRVIAELKH